MRCLLVVALIAACGGHAPPPITAARTPTPGENILALLPDGAQVIVEIDLARLRANPAIGETAKQALGAN